MAYPWPNYQANTVEPSHADAIMAAIVTIATTNMGITFPGSRAGNGPLEWEILAATPFFAVLQGELLGYAENGQLMGMGHGMMQGEREPVWSFDLYAIYRFEEAAPDYASPATALRAMELAFHTYVNVNGTCAKCEVIKGTSRSYPVIGGKTYIAAKMSLAVYEQLQIDYP